MKITRIANGRITVDQTVNGGNYHVQIKDEKGNIVFDQNCIATSGTHGVIDISALTSTNDGKRFSVTITDSAGNSDKVSFTVGLEWRLNAPARPSSVNKVIDGMKNYRLWVSVVCLFLAIFCLSLVPWKSAWNYMTNSSSSDNEQKNEVVKSEQKTEVLKKNFGGVKTIPKESVPLPTTTSSVSTPLPVIKTTNMVGSTITLTNIIGLFPGGLAISSSGSSNNIIIVGRDFKVGGGNEQSQVSWPSGIKPTRTIILTPDENKKIGEIDDRIIDLQSHEDVLLIIPENWNVKTFPSRDFLPSQYDSAVDENTESASGQLQVGHTIRYRNKTTEVKKLGVRCTKLRDLDGFWKDNK